MRSADGIPTSWLVMVAAIAVALYANSLRGAFVYDDLNAITQHALVLEGDVGRILTTASWWGQGRGQLWRPLTTLTFAFEHAAYGLAPFGYHVANVALHAVVSVLVLVVLAAAGVAARVAFAAALLFAAHPVHTEAVANVVGRAELLAATAFLLAWRAWLAADAATDGRRTTWRLAATALYALAMLAKENAIALPAVLLYADLLRRGDEPATALLRRRAPAYAGMLIAAIAFVAVRGLILGALAPKVDLLDNPLAVLPPLPRFLTAVHVLGSYAVRLLFPLRLSADYSYDQIPAVATPLDPGFLAGLAVVVAGTALAWWAWRRLPSLALGLGVLALTFALVSNLVVTIGTIMGERLLYLPSIGFCLALAAALDRVAGATASRATPWPRAFVVPLALVLVLYGARTVGRNTVWRDPLTFATTMTIDAPRSARSHAELASALAEAGRLDDAGREFERALAIRPEDPTTLYNWGVALMHGGRYDDAAAAYRRAIAAKPKFGEAYENLGNVESARGDQQAALAALDRARALTPESPYLLMTIAAVQARAGAIAEARATYARALAERPTDPVVREAFAAFVGAYGDGGTPAD